MIERSLFEYLVNSLWQLPLLVAAAWLLIRIARPPLPVQYALWLIALLFAVTLPLRGIDWDTPANSPQVPLLMPATAMEVQFDHSEAPARIPDHDTPVTS